MADRVFPATEREEGLASTKEFNGIDWMKVAEGIRTSSEQEATKLPEGLSEILEQGIQDDDLRTASKDVVAEENTEDQERKPEKSHQFDNAFDTAPKDIGETGRVKKVHFTSPEQISAEAITHAKEAGSEELVNTILAARQVRRQKLASLIQEKESSPVKSPKDKKQTLTVQNVANKNSEREKLASTIEKGLTKIADNKSKVKITVSGGFKKTSSLNSTERRAFAEAAISNGFPQEYVDQMLGEEPVKREASSEKQIREIMASSLPMSTKKAALQGMTRIAVLDEAQKQRIIDYWIKDLHYGDPEWVRNWVNASYN